MGNQYDQRTFLLDHSGLNNHTACSVFSTIFVDLNSTIVCVSVNQSQTNVFPCEFGSGEYRER
ncbi:hypothetical protein M378DRAFT_168360 [Amanita muscaria Koide BX008]|uniref:Uncharacterized protein n=1 Tax=Amanita muscaria (strain Koide BX008) TaxID=946122 RepID=A0A0C2WFM5_AMAMK|nr:hypothetical protein M378DRAFT_168360 [Amanita muscaria Koide BX008]